MTPVVGSQSWPKYGLLHTHNDQVDPTPPDDLYSESTDPTILYTIFS